MKLTKQENAVLMEVRGIIRGWAFAPFEWIQPKIQRADQAANSLTGIAKAQANDLIQPLRDRLKEGK